MKRRTFLSSLALIGMALPSALLAKTELLRSDSRTIIKKGWMDMKQSFNYFDYDYADVMGFGVLRVIDDFTIHHLTGTPKHPHRNMEILTIILEGQVFHQDSMGNSGLLKKGDMQLMSAGKGLKHAETNPSQFDTLKGLQIWISPKERDTKPMYQEKNFEDIYFTNQLGLIFSQKPTQGEMSIKLDARLYRTKSTKEMVYNSTSSSKKHGFYIFMIEGFIHVNNTTLRKGDGLGISEISNIILHANKGSDFLLFEIPMEGDF